MADLNDRLATALHLIFGHGEAPTVCGPHEIAVGLVPGEDLLLVEALERAAGLGRQSVSGAPQPAMPEERVLWTTFGHAIVDLPGGHQLDVPVALLNDPAVFAASIRRFIAAQAEELGERREAWRAARGAVPNLGAPSEEIIRKARGGEL